MGCPECKMELFSIHKFDCSAARHGESTVLPRVLNRKALHTMPRDAVYIGRPSKWGNPFSHVRDSSAQWTVDSREEAVARHAEWIIQQGDLMASLRELCGRNLVCWCAPKPCHGDTLIGLANAPEIVAQVLPQLLDPSDL